MHATRRTLAAFCAFCLWNLGPLHSWERDTLRVHLAIEFDRTITSNVVKKVVRNEAAAIWDPYGVELLWSDRESDDAALRLGVVIARHQPDAGLDGSPAVLGCARVNRSGIVGGPILISLDAIEKLLRQRPSDPVLHDLELGRALGRVLAHELGHVLLGGPTYHDPTGLMRARLVVDDLARFDRASLRLPDASVTRLHARISRVSEAEGPELGTSSELALLGCGNHEEGPRVPTASGR